MIHIYTGDGKGKTTAVIGAAIRAAATGKKVIFFQFLKPDDSGERKVLSKIDNITIINTDMDIPFLYKMSDSQKEELRLFYKEKLFQIDRAAIIYDYFIFDEAVGALNSGLIELNQILPFREYGEVFITGRGDITEIEPYADYITHMQKIRHPYDKGIEARKGIEY